MDAPSTGPVAAEIEQRLRDALAPTRLAVINDSEKHRGHAGHDGSGESGEEQNQLAAGSK